MRVFTSKNLHEPHNPLGHHVDGASAAAFRFLFGGVMFFALCRFMATGQVEALFLEPTFFFKYEGLGWVQPWPSAALMYAHCCALAVLALCVAFGLFFRPAIILFGLGFLWLELIDVTNYLNHYYLVVLLAGVMSVMPLGRVYSLDGWRRPATATTTIPSWALWLLRFQVAVVYVNAGLAKATADWLFHAQPLGIWFAARADTPIIGPLLAIPQTAFVASWAGFLFDLTVVLWLSWKVTRPLAYAGLIVFHVVTGVLFEIGIFPILMTTAALIFFSPSWPRALLRRREVASRIEPHALSRFAIAALVLWCAVQIALPLRHFAYPGDVSWNEQGMRFSWKVMLRAKHGSVTFRIRDTVTGREVYENPKKYLTHRQVTEMATQPDLIVQAAEHVGSRISALWGHPVEVRADAWASLNGRPMARLVNPDADLLTATTFILPEPQLPPLSVMPTERAQASR